MATTSSTPVLVRACDPALSDALGQSAVPQECYRNAAMALFTGGRPELEHACYVEGIAVRQINGLLLPAEHAWLELADGRFVDPTWCPASGHPGVAYFPIQRWTPDEVVQAVTAHQPFPLLSRQYGQFWLRHPRTRPAWTQAREFIAAITTLATPVISDQTGPTAPLG